MLYQRSKPKVLPQIECTYQQINKAGFKGVNQVEQKVFNEVLQKMMINLKELPGEKFELKYILKKTYNHD